MNQFRPAERERVLLKMGIHAAEVGSSPAPFANTEEMIQWALCLP